MKRHAYADDEQSYDSDSDPITLDQRMHAVQSAEGIYLVYRERNDCQP